MTDAEEQYPDRDPQLIYEIARDHLLSQLDFVDAVDNKIATFLVLGSGLVGILATIFALRPQAFNVWAAFALSIAGVAYVALSVASVWSYWLRSWYIGPGLREVWADHYSHQERELKWRAAAAYLGYYEENTKIYTNKTRAMKLSLACVIIETLALTAGLSLVAAEA